MRSGHDLRNPLSAIRTGAHLLMKRAKLDAGDVALAERITLSADHMSRMIDELMDFARGAPRRRYSTSTDPG